MWALNANDTQWNERLLQVSLITCGLLQLPAHWPISTGDKLTGRRSRSTHPSVNGNNAGQVYRFTRQYRWFLRVLYFNTNIITVCCCMVGARECRCVAWVVGSAVRWVRNDLLINKSRLVCCCFTHLMQVTRIPCSRNFGNTKRWRPWVNRFTSASMRSSAARTQIDFYRPLAHTTTVGISWLVASNIQQILDDVLRFVAMSTLCRENLNEVLRFATLTRTYILVR